MYNYVQKADTMNRAHIYPIYVYMYVGQVLLFLQDHGSTTISLIKDKYCSKISWSQSVCYLEFHCMYIALLMISSTEFIK